MVNKKPKFGWVVRYKGKRGGRWQTVPTTEEAARKRFSEFKQCEYAELGEVKPFPICGAIFEVKEKTATVEIEMYEHLVKDHKKKKVAVEKAIESCTATIKELKKRIKEE
jgi:hypothetical protein